MKTAALLAWLLCFPAQAAVIAIGGAEGVVVRLTDEPCSLAEVTNLPRRATWEEGGKTYEGCWGRMGGMIAGYFSDRTVAVIPVSAFTKAVGT